MSASRPVPAPRNRYADLLRVVAIGLVVLGHWLLTSISDTGGQLSGGSAMADIGWSGWGTLVFQVMPVFFLVGGYVNALSWARHRSAGGTWAGWVRHRAARLLRPTTVFVAVIVIAVAACARAGADPAELAQAGWGVALQLWFLPVYLVLIALTPALHAAHRRWGLAVAVVLTAAVAGVDAGVLGARLAALGYANYLLVWGTMHQWGFAWQDGTLTRRRWRPWALAAAGGLALGLLLAWGPFPVNMVGTAGGGVNNTIPPSVALLAFAAAQAGLVLAAEPLGSAVLARRAGLWRRVTWLNDRVLTVYLWHMVPVVVVALALQAAGILPRAAAGSAGWWALRPAWIAALAVVLAPAAIFLARFERPPRRWRAWSGAAVPDAALADAALADAALADAALADAALPDAALPDAALADAALPGAALPALVALGAALVALGVTAAGVALARIAVDGFAPGGGVPVPVVAAYGGGVTLILLAGPLTRARRADARKSAAPPQPAQPGAWTPAPPGPPPSAPTSARPGPPRTAPPSAPAPAPPGRRAGTAS